MSSRVFQGMKHKTESPVKANIPSLNIKSKGEFNGKPPVSFNQTNGNDFTYKRGSTFTV